MILRSVGGWLMLVGFGISIQPIFVALVTAFSDNKPLDAPDGMVWWFVHTTNPLGMVLLGIGAALALIGFRHLVHKQRLGPS